jgi:hypothetical protein
LPKLAFNLVMHRLAFLYDKERFMHALAHWIEPSFTILSFLLALKTIIDCAILLKRLNIQDARLEEVRSSLEAQSKNASSSAKVLDGVSKAVTPTTLSLGEFPDYLPSITKLIEECDGPLRIMAPVPGHGAFSRADEWARAKFAISQAHARGVDIRLVCSDAALRSQLLQCQFPRIFSDWEGVINEGSDLTRMIQEFIPRSSRKTLADVTQEEFLKLVMDDDRDTIAHTFRSAVVTELSTAHPLWVWIAGESEAIFAFPTHPEKPTVKNSGGSVAQAVMTKDREIVKSLIQVFTRAEQEKQAA